MGLWGGLYCFPQFSEREELNDWLSQQKLGADALQQLTAFRHTFSHFHLDIVPMLLDSADLNKTCREEKPGIWYDLANPPSVGLAAPVERLLQQLSN